MQSQRCDPRLNAVASLKLLGVVRVEPEDAHRDPRLNAVASLKLVASLAAHFWLLRDPRLNAVASLKHVSGAEYDEAAEL